MMRDVFALAHEEFDDVEMEGGPSDFLDAIGGALLQACDVYCRKQGRDPELGRLPYHEYLRTPHWRDTRRRALQRAGYQCKRCEARGERFEVHHLTYDRLGRELEGDLVVLCESCHALEHMPKHRREAFERIQELERRRRR
jgi:5-methylcytosine-specific restriction endonuclease McrA